MAGSSGWAHDEEEAIDGSLLDGVAFLIVLAGVLWDGMHDDWNWHGGLTLAIILVNAEILRRRPTQ